jgi:hypothetical protein
LAGSYLLLRLLRRNYLFFLSLKLRLNDLQLIMVYPTAKNNGRDLAPACI